MKHAILMSLLLISAASADAQVMGGDEPFVEVGVKLGGDLQHISAPISVGPGVIAGGYARKDIGRFGVRIEIMGNYCNYATKYPAAYYLIHTPTMDTLSKGEFQGIGISVPVMVEYQVNKKLKVLAGPQYRQLVSLSDKNDAYTTLYGKNSFLKKGDFSIVAGAELAVKKKFSLGARLMKGVTDINKSPYYLAPKTWTTTGFQVAVSYKIL
jgi:hypothetical protein